MRLETCTFTRTEFAPIERGVLINEGQLIIDEDGKPIKKCWMWDRSPAFAINLFTDAATPPPTKKSPKRCSHA
jgi:hypothetical protein